MKLLNWKNISEHFSAKFNVNALSGMEKKIEREKDLRNSNLRG